MHNNRFKIVSISCLAIFFSVLNGYAQSKEKLFTLLSSEHTNIDFNNKLEDKKEHNILIYSNYYGGAGVGVGDFNQDGLQDIFLQAI